MGMYVNKLILYFYEQLNTQVGCYVLIDILYSISNLAMHDRIQLITDNEYLRLR